MSASTPRRSNRIKDKSTPSTPSTSSLSANGNAPKTSTSVLSTAAMTSRQLPFKPTSLELLLLAAYPAALLIGSAFSLLDPTTRASPYSATTQSHLQDPAPSYFARKNNIFNVLFVKRGWFWVTASYLLFLFTHPSTGPAWQPLTLTPRRLQGLLRWALVTTWWVFVTQWFFGPALIDRGFRLTGGACELVRDAEAGYVELSDTKQFVTGMACKAVGGKWKGGHDISGHVFLLVLGSMFLMEELVHVLLKSAKAREERTIMMRDGAVKSADSETLVGADITSETAAQWDFGVKFVLGVVGLSMWMLLMTAVYFHTWFEKFTGLLVAFVGIFVVHFLPRLVPSMRAALGMPGV